MMLIIFIRVFTFSFSKIKDSKEDVGGGKEYQKNVLFKWNKHTK